MSSLGRLNPHLVFKSMRNPLRGSVEKDSGQYVELELQATADRILKGAKAYLESQKAKGSGAFGYVDGGKWIPHLSTFLNGGRWEDWL